MYEMLKTLSTEQEAALEHIKHNLKVLTSEIVISGYAGTGKSELLAHVVKWLQENDIPFFAVSKLNAAVGRLNDSYPFIAARTLTKTFMEDMEDRLEHINLELTALFRLEKRQPLSFDESERREKLNLQKSSIIEQQLTLTFSGKTIDKKCVVLIDEAGTLSKLDYLTYLSNVNALIVFFGDADQLGPWCNAKSDARAGERYLDFSNAFELTTQFRQEDILAKAINALRTRKPYKIKAGGVVNYNSMICDSFVLDNWTKGAMLVCQKNEDRWLYNSLIRKKEGRLPKCPEVGEKLILGRSTDGFTAGDMVEIVPRKNADKSVGDSPNKFITRLNLKRLTDGWEQEVTCNICDLLQYDREQKDKTSKKYDNQIKGALAEADVEKANPVKYTYAMTAHSAQGREAEDVFVVSPVGVSTQKSYTDWLYTASSRAKKRLFCMGNFLEFE
jgi:AAA domain/UvrD-like helicase C-terminal domain